MTNDDKKMKNEGIKALGVLLIALIIFLFGGLCMWVWMDESRRAEALKPTANTTLLPIVAGPFKQNQFIVYELEHGWMVVREAGVSSHFFVPKPSK